MISQRAANQLNEAIEKFEEFDSADRKERRELSELLVYTLLENRQFSDAQRVANSIAGSFGTELKLHVSRVRMICLNNGDREVGEKEVASLKALAKEKGHLILHVTDGIDGMLAKKQLQKVQEIYDCIEGDISTYEYRPKVYDNLHAKLEVLSSIVGAHLSSGRDDEAERLINLLQNSTSRRRLIELVVVSSTKKLNFEVAEKAIGFAEEKSLQRDLIHLLGIRLAKEDVKKSEKWADHLENDKEGRSLFANLCLHIAYSKIEDEESFRDWLSRAKKYETVDLGIRADALSLEALRNDLEDSDDPKLSMLAFHHLLGFEKVHQNSVLVRFDKNEKMTSARKIGVLTKNRFVQARMLYLLLERAAISDAEGLSLAEDLSSKIDESKSKTLGNDDMFVDGNGGIFDEDELMMNIARSYALLGHYEKSIDMIEQISDDVTSAINKPQKRTTKRKLGLEIAALGISRRSDNFSSKKSSEIISVVKRLSRFDGEERNEYLNELIVGLLKAKQWEDASTAGKIAVDDWNGKVTFSSRVFERIAISGNVKVLHSWFEIIGEKHGKAYLNAICRASNRNRLVPSSPFVIEIEMLFKRHELGSMPPHVLNCLAIGLWADGMEQKAMEYIEKVKDSEGSSAKLKAFANHCLKCNLPRLAFRVVEMLGGESIEYMIQENHLASDRYTSLVEDKDWYSHQSPRVQILTKINCARKSILDQQKADRGN